MHPGVYKRMLACLKSTVIHAALIGSGSLHLVAIVSISHITAHDVAGKEKFSQKKK